MADKNGWSAALGAGMGGKSKLRGKHGNQRTVSKKHKTARGPVRGKRGVRTTGGR
jgi:hypothetical protein